MRPDQSITALAPATKWASPLLGRFSVFLICAGAVLWLCACLGGPPEKVAGGTGSEAGDAYGIARSVGGEKPSAFARVALFNTADSMFSHPEPYASTVADSLGQYNLAIRKSGSYDLEIKSKDGNAIIYRKGILLQAKGASDLGVDPIPEAARYSSRLSAPPMSLTHVWLAGTPYSALVDSLGRFSFSALPKGDYMLFSERTVGDTLERIILRKLLLQPGDSLSMPDTVTVPKDTVTIPKDTVTVPKDSVTIPPIDSTQILSPMDTLAPGNTSMSGQVMVDDFADGDYFSLFGKAYGGGGWSSRSVLGTNEQVAGLFKHAITTENAYRDKSMKIEYTPMDPYKSKFIIELSMDPLNSKLFTTDTLVFYARGSGNLNVDLDWGFPSRTLAGHSIIILTQGWKKYQMPIQATAVASQNGRPSYVRFTLSEGSDFGLDDVSLKGTQYYLKP